MYFYRMTNAPIRLIILLGAAILSAIIGLQVYWSSIAVNSLQAQFSHSVRMSLQNVVESVCEVNGTDVPVRNPVEQVSDAYFIVRTNQPIQPATLEGILATELQNRGIKDDFEFGVYNCLNDQMVYGSYVKMNSETSVNQRSELPKLEQYDHYFGIFFPNRKINQLFGLDWLKFTTIMTIGVFLFFAYAIFILLRQKKLSAIQRDFINNVTHEFKTPISSLKIASEALQNDVISAQPEKVSRYSKLIQAESERLESHVEQLLRSAQISHRSEVSIKPTALSRLIHTVEERVTPLLMDKQLTVDIQSDSKVLADPYLLEISLYNLLENAIKYGGNNIRLGVKEADKKVLIQISDDGNGVAEKERKKIFGKFYRVSEGDQHNVQGFGLGLFVVKTAMSRMGGSVKLVAPDKALFELELKTV
ncbi:MAG: two-component system phosphate regulon sensor histidine kinase PhoR [Cyclobacteriaceae bacterium]|jgi:two-component system phosphate regulon sensor histidine kinase PhoR